MCWRIKCSHRSPLTQRADGNDIAYAHRGRSVCIGPLLHLYKHIFGKEAVIFLSGIWFPINVSSHVWTISCNNSVCSLYHFLCHSLILICFGSIFIFISLREWCICFLHYDDDTYEWCLCYE